MRRALRAWVGRVRCPVLAGRWDCDRRLWSPAARHPAGYPGL